MNTEDLDDKLDRWGADLDTWPTDDRNAALSLMERSLGARVRVQRTRTIETALAEGATAHRAPVDLAMRILNDSRLGPHQVHLEDPFSGFVAWLKAAIWRPALLAAVPLAVGFVLGMSSGYDEDALAQNLTALTLISAFDEIDYEDQ